MRKVKIKIYFNSMKYEFMNLITMTTDTNDYYVLWDEEPFIFDGQHPLFNGATTVDEERVMLANMALENKGHTPLTPKEAVWMLENVETEIRQS